jgi:hypothetical protein
VKRHAHNISSSENTYNYTVGTYSSINVGNSYSYRSLPSSVKKTVNVGKTISMSIGNTQSVSNITNNESTIKGNSYSIKELTGQVSYESMLALQIETRSLLAQDYSIETPVTSSFEIDLTRWDITAIPVKGHFTALQQIISGVYADWANYENLARVLGFSFTFQDKNSTREYDADVAQFNKTTTTKLEEIIVKKREAKAKRMKHLANYETDKKRILWTERGKNREKIQKSNKAAAQQPQILEHDAQCLMEQIEVQIEDSTLSVHSCYWCC